MNSKKVTILLVFTILLIFSVVSRILFNDFQDGWIAYEKQDYKTAHELWLPLAEQGDPKAQFFLGFMHDMGFGVPENDKQAFKWYKLTAEKGDSRAQLFTGFMYDFGKGVPKDYQKAVKWYQLASEQGYMQAKRNIYKLAEKNSVEALEILLNDAKKGSTEAKVNLAAMREVELMVTQNYQTGLNRKQISEEQKYVQLGKTMLELANLDNHEKTINTIIGGAEMMNKAQNVLGMDKALKWYKPAEYGARIYKYNLAKQNTVEALQYLIRLSIDSEKGIAEAQYILATMYADGIGVSQDNDQAFNLFLKIARKTAKSDIEGGRLEDTLKFKAKNIPQELKFLTNDADSGIATAQWKLGSLYARGQFFTKDIEKATKLYLLAAEQGNSWAQYTLGMIYATGHIGNYTGSIKTKKAIKWFRLYLGQTTIKLGQTTNELVQTANKLGQKNIKEQRTIYSLAKKNVIAALNILMNDATNGIAIAQYYLGYLYRDGIGVSRNYTRAYMWYHLSALQGNKNSSDQMTSLEKIMSPKEIQHAKYLGSTYRLYYDKKSN
jgi:TPR repeat protein